MKEAGDAEARQGSRNPYEFRIAKRVRAERKDPAGVTYAVLFDTYGRPMRYIDELGEATGNLLVALAELCRRSGVENELDRGSSRRRSSSLQVVIRFVLED